VARLLQNATHAKLASYRSVSPFSAPTETPGNLPAASRVTALSIEFVAKPNETHRLQTALPAALDSTLHEVAGFAGALVFIANYEARLVTVVTLWTGEDRIRQCGENLKWVRALLNPYMDRCLRVQTLAAFAPGASVRLPNWPAQTETDPLISADCEASEPAVCAA
jgi:hypothetical protein